MGGDQNGKYDLEKDFFVLKLKAIINAIRETPFDAFLKGFFEASVCMPPPLAFGRVVCGVLEAIEYAHQKKEVEIPKLADVLVYELEEKDSFVSKAFACLIKKAMRLNEAGISLAQISNTFEFRHLVDEFEKFNFSSGEKKESFSFGKYSAKLN